MEGDFVVGYLGNTVLSKGTASGLGTIQKPLRDAYFEYRKTSGKKGKKKELTEVGLRVTPQGVYILIAGSHPGSNESFYDMPSITFFEAVTFKTVKGTDKKVQAGFLPIDISRSPNTGSEKLFTPLDKKYQTFAKMDHPPIIALVMRRTTGVRALECHSFICESEQQALAIVNLIGTLQSGPDPRSVDYQRQSGGPYDPYAGPPRRPDLVQGDFRDPGPGYQRGGPGQADYPRPGQRPQDGWEGGDSDRYGGGDPRGFLEPPRDDRFMPPRGYDDDDCRMKGDNRYYEEEVRYRHDRQRSGDYGPEEDFMNRRSGDFRHERQRSSEYGRDTDSREGRFPEEEVRYRHERQRSSEIRRSEEFGDRRSGDYRHVRQKSGEFQGDRRSAGFVHERQSSGDVTPRDDLRSSRDMRDYGRQGRPEVRPDNQFRIPRPMSPGRQGPATAPKPPRALSPGPYRGDGDYQQRPPLRSPRDERGPPPGPLRSPREERGPPPPGPEYSLSSLESRQEMENRPNKPVARVPPHLVAGVKVLPTGFSAVIQQKAAQKLPRSPVEERRHIPPGNDEEDPYDNAISRREFYKREGRNIKSEGDERERYFDAPGKDTRYTYHPPDILPPEERDRHREKFSDYDDVIRRDDNYNDQKGRNANYRYSAPPAEHARDNRPWTYEEQFQKFSKDREDDGQRHSAADFRFYDGGGGRKVYEVQDQFDKMNIRNQNAGRDTNFEESLGYFP